MKKIHWQFLIAILLTSALFAGCASSDSSGGAENGGEPTPDSIKIYESAQEPSANEADGEIPELISGNDYAVSESRRPSDNAAEEQTGIPNRTGSDANWFYRGGSGESYLVIDENTRSLTSEEAMVTLSLKVDTASYNNVQRYISSRQVPPRNAVKTEELINYFSYDKDMYFNGHPFSIYTEVAPSPLDAGKHLAFIRVKALDLDKTSLPPSNLTFLIDTSGSMSSYDKLPLLKEAFHLLVEELDEDDTVSIVTYAGQSKVALSGARGSDKDLLHSAIDDLSASGSTAGAEGIQTAYRLAEENFVKDGNNRIILATDGDFNVGISNVSDLEDFISGKRETGVYLSVLGFGTGNIRDDVMETLAKNGNGNYSYINTIATAEKVLVEELTQHMFVIAEDVKAQVEFNPDNVRSYRLIGYENSRLENRDFKDDTKDAGEIGAGTDVVVLFELELNRDSDYKYGGGAAPQESGGQYGDELFEVRIRYKHPGEENSNQITAPVTFDQLQEAGSSDFQFAAAVAAYGEMLRSDHIAQGQINDIMALAEDHLGKDPRGYRVEFLETLYDLKNILF